MRHKQVIELNCNRAKQIAEYLYRDTENNKPHATKAYMLDQLSAIIEFLNQQQQYLDLED